MFVTLIGPDSFRLDNCEFVQGATATCVASLAGGADWPIAVDLEQHQPPEFVSLHPCLLESRNIAAEGPTSLQLGCFGQDVLLIPENIGCRQEPKAATQTRFFFAAFSIVICFWRTSGCQIPEIRNIGCVAPALATRSLWSFSRRPRTEGLFKNPHMLNQVES